MTVLHGIYYTHLQVWFSNVPHNRLVDDKGGQNWISRDKNKFKFPGGGTQFIHGADEYLDHISKVSIILKLACLQKRKRKIKIMGLHIFYP